MSGREETARQEVIWIGELDEAMIGVLFTGDAEARNTGVEVWTVHTFVTETDDPRVTKVAHCIMRAWHTICDSKVRRLVRLGSANASISTG
jgi:hypothetical protein